MRRLFSLCFFVTLAACSRGASPHRSPEEPPQRIVSFKPNLTEIVFALGAGDRVVGVTEWCRYPEEAAKREKLGGLGTLNLERLAQIKPDLFLAAESMGDLCDRVERLGIRTLRVRDLGIEDVDAGVAVIGKALGLEAAADDLRRRMREKLDALAKRLEGAPAVKTLFVLERQPGTVLDISVVGPNNVIDSLIRLGGGQNIFADLPLPYPKASKEEILARDPEYILDFSVHGYSQGGDDAKEKAAWAALPTLRAVREGKIVIMPSGFDLSPGPRMPAIAEAFARILHPDRFQ